MKSSIVLSLPLQLVFPGSKIELTSSSILAAGGCGPLLANVINFKCLFLPNVSTLVFFPDKFLQPSVIIVGKARANLSEALFGCFSQPYLQTLDLAGEAYQGQTH